MNSAAFDISEFIEDQGIETTCYVNTEPTTPNNCVTVYDTGGSDPLVVADVFSPTIQVRVRNLTHQGAYAKQQTILAILQDAINETISLTNYVGIWLQGDIISLGQDENSRFILTANYKIMRSQNG